MKKKHLIQIVRDNLVLVSITALLLVIDGIIWFHNIYDDAPLQQKQLEWAMKRRQLASRAEAQLDGRYTSDKAQIQQLYAKTPLRHEFPRIISEILDNMALNDTIPGTMEYKTQKTSLENIVAYTMHCNATGTYPNLKRLIGRLEQLNGLSTLDSISFSSSEQRADKVALNLQLTIYLREK